MGFEPTTFCLASRRSTPELRPLLCQQKNVLKLPERSKSVNNVLLRRTASLIEKDGKGIQRKEF